jgi:hypothetical protein
MGNGPHCADVAQRYILQTMLTGGLDEDLENAVDPSHTHDGMEEWSIGEVFEDEVLTDFKTDRFKYPRLENPDYGFRALDEVYGAVDTTIDTNSGERNKRLEGLRALRTGFEFPVEGRTMRDWIQNYREAGLIIQEEDEIQVDPETSAVENVKPSPEGHVFLETDPRDYFFKGIGVENVGEVYRDLTTKKLGENGEPTGQKLEALFLYAAGLGHSEVSQATGLTYGTTKNFAYTMKDDHDLLTDNYRLTPEGFEFANMVLDQMDRLEEATESRVAAFYDGWDEVEPASFEGNSYMAQALKQESFSN